MSESVVETHASLTGICPYDGNGDHRWVPWLRISADSALPSASFVTRCLVCGRTEQWDV